MTGFALGGRVAFHPNSPPAICLEGLDGPTATLYFLKLTVGFSMTFTPPATPAADSPQTTPLRAMWIATSELLQAVSVLMQGPCTAQPQE